MSHYSEQYEGERERRLVDKYAPHMDPKDWSEWDLRVLFAERQEALEALRELQNAWGTVRRVLD